MARGYSREQYMEAEAAVLQALPDALEGIDPKMLVHGLKKRKEALGRALHDMMVEMAKSIILPYPEIGEPFVLTLPGDSHPMDMVYKHPHPGLYEKFAFRGREFSGPQTRVFKLERIPNFGGNYYMACTALAQYGATPEGQWCEAFYTAYSEPDGKGQVAIVDASWVLTDGGIEKPYYPCINGTPHDDGGHHICWLGFKEANWHIEADTRWIVPASK